jgi:hypothetical protein
MVKIIIHFGGGKVELLRAEAGTSNMFDVMFSNPSYISIAS